MYLEGMSKGGEEEKKKRAETPVCVIKPRELLRTRDSRKEQGRVAQRNQDLLLPAA